MSTSLVVLILSCACLIDGKHLVWKKGNANGMFDTIISKLKRLDAVASRIASLKVGDFKFKHGRISQIEVLGLDSFSRSGSVTATLADDKAVIEANIGLWDIRFVGSLQLPILNIAGAFVVKEPHVSCRVRLTFSVHKMYLNHFEILHLSQFELRELPDLGSLNWLSRNVIQNELRKMYPFIRNELERNVERELAKGLRSFDLFETACRIFAASLEDDIH